jgi:hypothetical protein
VCWVVLWRGCLVSLPVVGQDGPRFGYHRVAAVDDEQQDGHIVEPARDCGVRHELTGSPGGEREDGHQPQEAVPTLGRPADADGSDGGGDKEQGGG